MDQSTKRRQVVDSTESNIQEVDWASLQKRLDSIPTTNLGPSSSSEKKRLTTVVEHFKAQPLIYTSLIATTAFLAGGIANLRSGNRRRSNLLMRGRVLSHGVCGIAMFVALFQLAAPHVRFSSENSAVRKFEEMFKKSS